MGLLIIYFLTTSNLLKINRSVTTKQALVNYIYIIQTKKITPCKNSKAFVCSKF